MDTRYMRDLTRLAPPDRIARWAVSAVVAGFVLISALQQLRGPAVTVAATAVAVAAALLMDPRRPALLPVFAALSGAGLIVLGSGSASDFGWFGICVITGWCALTDVRAAVVLWAAFVVTFGLEWLLTTNDLGWASYISGTTFATFACILGRRQHDLAQRLRAAQAGLAERVRADERTRIARELHDVLAHSLTVSLLHVSSARLAVEEDPAEAARALAEAERLGRECLAEVRQVVGLLRHEPGAPSAPLPGAGQLAALAEDFRGAGADVRLDCAGDLTQVPATVGLALYRILQEALTNAARHAPGTGVLAALTVTPASAVLTVDSAGRPGAGAGDGLLSMRERAEVLGGSCSAGPADGGWRVQAELPLRPAQQPVAYP